MFVNKISGLALASALMFGCTPPNLPSKNAAVSGQTIKAACGERDGWSDPAPPQHVFANVYMVGTCGITSLLITTSEGHFLIDGATNEAADGIADNIRKLGFKPEDVKLLLITHEHLDHAGGIARLKEITKSAFAARQPALAVMETGLPQGEHPQHGLHPAFPGAKADRVLDDGDVLQIGSQKITVMATPGHSPGGSSYVWKSCEGAVCRSFVYADSLNAVSADAYRFTDHPEYVATLRSTIARIETLPKYDIMVSPHPFQSELFERLAGEAPLVDPDMCKKYAKAARTRLDTRLAKEASTLEAAN